MLLEVLRFPAVSIIFIYVQLLLQKDERPKPCVIQSAARTVIGEQWIEKLFRVAFTAVVRKLLHFVLFCALRWLTAGIMCLWSECEAVCRRYCTVCYVSLR